MDTKLPLFTSSAKFSYPWFCKWADLLHSGHVEFFRQAAEYGDLYVGIGSDATIEAYKGHRTLYPEQEEGIWHWWCLMHLPSAKSTQRRFR